MILTTHFMDEADILGDRVAILAHGRLQCLGSPYFLKRHYGVGYMLVVVKDEDFDADACTDLINEYIPDIAIKEDRGNFVTSNIITLFKNARHQLSSAYNYRTGNNIQLDKRVFICIPRHVK